MKKTFLSVRDMALCAMFAALMAVCAWISIPVLEIAFTLQTFAVFAALGILGGKRGTISVAVYLLLGLVGLPVFAGFRGTEALVGVTGGYIVGFLASALVYWFLTARLGEAPWVKLLGMVIGLVVCYAFGSMWFYFFYLNKGTPMALSVILAKCVIPYIIPDALKIALAMVLSTRLKPLLKI